MKNLNMDRSKLEVITHPHTLEPLKDKFWIKELVEGQFILGARCKRYWASSGTVLGLYRNGEVIPHDTDIDFETDDIDAADSIIESFKEHGYRLVRVTKYMGLTMQLAFISQNKVVVDIYFYINFEDKYLINYNDHGILVLENKFVNKIEEYGEWGTPFPTPTEEYLTERYGDWKTPTTEKGEWEKQAKNLIVL